MIQSVQVVEKFLGACLECLGAWVDAIVALLVSCQERSCVMILDSALFLKNQIENSSKLKIIEHRRRIKLTRNSVCGSTRSSSWALTVGMRDLKKLRVDAIAACFKECFFTKIFQRKSCVIEELVMRWCEDPRGIEAENWGGKFEKVFGSFWKFRILLNFLEMLHNLMGYFEVLASFWESSDASDSSLPLSSSSSSPE